MSASDRWATVFYIVALVILIAMGTMEYRQYGERTKINDLVQKEKDLKTKADALRTRAAAAEQLKPVIAALEAQMLKSDNGNYYRQILLDGVAHQRATRIEFPNLDFSTAGTAGRFPRFSLSGVASGNDGPLLDFVRLFEEGPYKVQVSSITYTSAAGAAAMDDASAAKVGGTSPVSVSGGHARINVSFIYTADKPQQ